MGASFYLSYGVVVPVERSEWQANGVLLARFVAHTGRLSCENKSPLLGLFVWYVFNQLGRRAVESSSKFI
jgi:hypothetical protein